MMLETTTDSEIWKAVQAAKDATAGHQVAAIMRDEPLPPAGVIAVPHAQLLWRAVLGRCEQLAPRGKPSMRTAGAYGTDGRSCSAFLSRSNEDGTSTSWFISAHYNPAVRKEYRLSVTVHGPATDNHDAEWEARLAGDRSRAVICGHQWYTVGSGSGGGFGGARFRFRPLDGGPGIVSNDMWFGGTIPPAWRERIPDTHEMLEGRPPSFNG